jgi:hypothetical protein
MLPATIKRAGDAGADYLVRAIMGTSPEEAAKIDAARSAGPAGQIDSVVSGAQDAVRGVMDDNLHRPETTAGHYAETLGEFVAPGGLPSKATRAAPTLLRKAGGYLLDLGENAVVPALTSETAGQLSEGTKAEPYARLLGALFGNLTVHGLKAANTPEALLRQAVPDPGEVDWAKARALLDNSTGIRLTGPEAIAQAQGGGSALPDVLRVVEGSLPGRAKTGPFFAARPGQVDTAVGNLLDDIGPQSAVPSELGPRVSQAAESAITASPEGQALIDAISKSGPRTTAQQAGEVIQPALGAEYKRLVDARGTAADADYAAARAAAPTIPVDSLQPQSTMQKPGYTRLEPGENAITGQPEMQPSAVPPQYQTPALASNTGPDMIQVDARSAVRDIDALLAREAETSAAHAALRDARGLLFRDGDAVNTSVTGLESARNNINGMISEAKKNAQSHVVERLERARDALDKSLASSPEYAQANKNFASASAPLEPFNSPGVAKTIRRDEFNSRFATPTEEVPGHIATPSEAQNFKTVATPEAQTAMANHLATKVLDSVTDGAGNISGEALAKALRDNEDLLNQFPEVRLKLQAVIDAQGGMASARSGPIGDVASAGRPGPLGETGGRTEAAGSAILPAKPLTGSESETADAVRRLVQQDPEATTGVVRQNLADRFGSANTVTQGGDREFAGAKFVKDIAGNEQKRNTLEAVLQNLPTDDAMKRAPELLDVLEATAHRKPIGSATAFTNSTQGVLGSGSPAGRVRDFILSLGTSAINNAKDMGNKIAYRHSITTLADMFTDPKSVDVIRDALGRSLGTGVNDALRATVKQSGTTTRPGK